VLVPKVSSAAEVDAYDQLLGGAVPLWAMIETCAAVFALDAIGGRAAHTGLAAWVIGTNDLAKEMRCQQGVERTPLLGILSLAVAAARLHGLTVLDGVYNDIADEAGLERQCRQGLEFGFDGKTLIHPSQIAAANRAFSPAEDDVAWARAVVAAFDLPENISKGVIRLDGRMVERLHLAQAQTVIDIADAIAAHGG